MGLFDKLKDKVSGMMPDHAAVLQEQLGQERHLAHVGVLPSATETDRSSRPKDLTELAQGAAHELIDKTVQDRHIGGEEGSIARSLPRSADPVMLALAEGSVTVWKFGLGAKAKAPDLVVRVPREQIASIADTGSRKARGHLRLTFTDESFFDYQTLAAPTEEFWAAAEGFGAA